MKEYYQRNKERLKEYGKKYFKEHYKKKGRGIYPRGGRRKQISPEGIKMLNEICYCGHSQLCHSNLGFNPSDYKYENPQVRQFGHGACMNTYCKCKIFTFKEFKNEVEKEK